MICSNKLILARSLNFTWSGFQHEYEDSLSRYIEIHDNIHHTTSHQGLQMTNTQLQTISAAYVSMRDCPDRRINTKDFGRVFQASKND